MAFERITEDDLQGKGNLGRPDTPGVDTTEMQRILDELPREVIVPAFNRLAEQLEAADAAASLGARPPEGLPEGTPATAQGVLEAMQAGAAEHAARTDNPHAVTAAQTGAYTKEETEEAIGRRVVEIGAGDMAQAVYDPARLGVDVTVQTYTHTRSGTVHNFAGHPVLDGILGREQQDVGVVPPAPQPAQQRQPVYLWEHPVQDDAVIVRRLRVVQTVPAVKAAVHGVPLLRQAFGQDAIQRRIVFNHQNTHTRSPP